jgi:hypothetical protein
MSASQVSSSIYQVVSIPIEPGPHDPLKTPPLCLYVYFLARLGQLTTHGGPFVHKRWYLPLKKGVDLKF